MTSMPAASLVLTALPALLMLLLPSPAAAARTLHQANTCPVGTFAWPAGSGYCWYRRDSGNRREGPGNNLWSSSANNIVLNADGSLELRMVQGRGRTWTCAEVFLDRSLGYGSYIWRVESNPFTVNRNIVASPGFLYASPISGRSREADIEYGRFGNAAAPSTQYALQPYTAAGAVRAVDINAINLTHRMRWSNATGSPSDFLFETFSANGSLLSSWSPSGGDYFTPGDETLHMNHWVYSTQGIPQTASLKINCFRFCALDSEAACAAPLGTMPAC